VSILVYFLFKPESYFLSKSPEIFDWFSNFLIYPLAYYMYNGIDKFTLLPPSWSLAVEIQFYLLVPFIFKNEKFLYISYFSSLSIFLLAIVGVLDTDFFAYRLLLGVLYIFLLGSILYEVEKGNKKAYLILIITYIVILFSFIYIIYFDYKAPYNYEVVTALLLGIPLLIYYKSLLPKNLDKFFGNISYGLFLLHFPALWIYKTTISTNVSIYVVLILSIALAMLGDFATNNRKIKYLNKFLFNL
jgi:peptidoglycan/LPS O-acetylase OafA/YrhL